MTMKQIPIADASAQQLSDFGTLVLGIEGLNYRLGRDVLIARLRGVSYDNAYISLPVEEKDTIQRVDPPNSGHARRMAVIRIHTDDKPGGAEPVPVAVNGKQMFVPRGQDCTIPWEYYHALNNARRYVYEQGPNGELLDPPREVHEYSFSLLREDPDLEVQGSA